MNALKYLVLMVFLSLFACENPEKEKLQSALSSLRGNTQGTTYQIVMAEDCGVKKGEIDSILDNFDRVLSTYKENSIISKINRESQGGFMVIDSFNYLLPLYVKSYEVFRKSNGAFDPTVKPLVELWGFGGEARVEIPGEKELDSVRTLVSFEIDRFIIANKQVEEYGDNRLLFWNQVVKAEPGIQLDFNAIAQGYSVDVLCGFLKKKGCENYLVEIGGELRAAGVKPDSSAWKIGVDEPIEGSTASNRVLKTAVELRDKAIATSGNYRKFYEIGGRKYAHTIDPKTGKPVEHHLLSATVMAQEAAIADAYATAFMVMGEEGTRSFLEGNPDLELEVYLIFQGFSGEILTWKSEGFSSSELNSQI